MTMTNVQNNPMQNGQTMLPQGQQPPGQVQPAEISAAVTTHALIYLHSLKDHNEHLKGKIHWDKGGNLRDSLGYLIDAEGYILNEAGDSLEPSIKSNDAINGRGGPYRDSPRPYFDREGVLRDHLARQIDKDGDFVGSNSGKKSGVYNIASYRGSSGEAPVERNEGGFKSQADRYLAILRASNNGRFAGQIHWDQHGNIRDEEGCRIDAQGNILNERNDSTRVKSKSFKSGAANEPRNENFPYFENGNLKDKDGKRINAEGFLVGEDGTTFVDDSETPIEGEAPKGQRSAHYDTAKVSSGEGFTTGNDSLYEEASEYLAALEAGPDTALARHIHWDINGYLRDRNGYRIDENGNILNAVTGDSTEFKSEEFFYANRVSPHNYRGDSLFFDRSGHLRDSSKRPIDDEGTLAGSSGKSADYARFKIQPPEEPSHGFSTGNRRLDREAGAYLASLENTVPAGLAGQIHWDSDGNLRDRYGYRIDENSNILNAATGALTRYESAEVSDGNRINPRNHVGQRLFFDRARRLRDSQKNLIGADGNLRDTTTKSQDYERLKAAEDPEDPDQDTDSEENENNPQANLDRQIKRLQELTVINQKFQNAVSEFSILTNGFNKVGQKSGDVGR